jgi:23S rRNA (guanine745-N1)-methyltransferase
MIAARRTFLAEGHYLPIYTALEQITLKHIKKAEHHSPLQVADLGCGEGYYTHQLDKALNKTLAKQESTVKTWGLDISKDAIINACKHSSNVNWLIANLGQTPFADHSMDMLTILFCPINPKEIVRLLKPGGIFIFVKPDAGHLIQLRERIYSDVKGQSEKTLTEKDKGIADHPVHHPELKLIDTQALFHPMSLDTAESIQALFKMTPHYWRTKPEEREKINQLNQLNTDIAVSLFCYQREH